MTPKCKFCGERADFYYAKDGTKEDPTTFPQTDFCHECFERVMGDEETSEYDPVQVKDMALEILKTSKASH